MAAAAAAAASGCSVLSDQEDNGYYTKKAKLTAPNGGVTVVCSLPSQDAMSGPNLAHSWQDFLGIFRQPSMGQINFANWLIPGPKLASQIWLEWGPYLAHLWQSN
ncbi:hypothetical protein CAPTEDRAFT_210221 [Capitella teleta]|uniref:Uncharacterized protein n=1 Tax=Capitella teleta TaxID=283909 RepID=R7UXS2_CAPTE|nr:hypothetical protein CAPTEDRAFT_210221 [Capitella teleta]|eukprot:ELU11378.1 hypothetical protein CAPTEDRAFT_210221 [Capitella teleta]